MTTTIEISDIHTSFGKSIIHQGVSFSVNKGEVIAIIGGSGTGKTVLLREMLGLQKPNKGKIKIFDTSIWEDSREEVAEVMKRIGVLFQTGALFSAMTVKDNVATPLREQSKLTEDQISELVDLRLLLSGLKCSDGVKLPAELSGGMVKRAALARALALEPELLMLDEPTSGLDPINARAFDVLIKTLAKNLGITVFMVTHDLDTLRTVPDRIVVLADGVVLAEGTFETVSNLEHPWIKQYFHGT